MLFASLALIWTAALARPATAQTSAAWPNQADAAAPLVVAGRKAQLTLSAVNGTIVRLRLSALPVEEAKEPDREDLTLVQQEWPGEKQSFQSLGGRITFKVAGRRVTVSAEPLTVMIEDHAGHLAQQLRFEADTGAFRFLLGDGPVLGLGEGGPQFDRRGFGYSMKSGQSVEDLKVNGARVPIPWLIGTSGWAMFVHAPLGGFDLTGKEGRFVPWDSAQALPLDVFIVATRDPIEMMKDYALLTGYPHMPPIWALGYQQSHRTLATRDEVISEAKTFREKKLPCDAFIFLGTGFCPSGWNTGHGSFTFNGRIFPDPGQMFRELHERHIHVVLHVVNPPLRLHGSVNDTGAEAADESDETNYWAKHLEVMRLGVDGWWPDEGDKLDVESRLVRNRMYWEGPQKERPNLRPYALHRNGYAGMQRYGWLWSGDVDSTWRTLAAQIPVGINTSLSGEPYWGTDTGGFVTTPELTGELYVRWFQFSSFCTLFRSHGRTWKLRLPWGWNLGDPGPVELEHYGSPAGLPDSKEFHNPDVEPICRKYLDLRYRMLPYLYSAVREAHDTGLPVMRALWLNYRDDAQAVQRSDEYLWGRDILVVPVTEKGATARKVYLPRGQWYDFWTEEKVEGGREIKRSVDLATMPLYVRAGAIIPMGPVRQYSSEESMEPLTVTIYPGEAGNFLLYEDDGATFNFTKGDFTRLRLVWNDARRTLAINLERGSRPLAPPPRKINVRLPKEKASRTVEFRGSPMQAKF